MAVDLVDRAWREYLDTVAGDIRLQLRSQNRVVFGRLINSIRVVENQYLKAEIRSLAYMEAVVDGVQPSKTGPNFLANIIQWMKRRGISPFRGAKVQPATQTNYERAGFSIMRSIVKFGSRLKRGLEPGIDLQTPIRENVSKLTRDMAKGLVIEFSEQTKIKKPK